jgi:transposase
MAVTIPGISFNSLEFFHFSRHNHVLFRTRGVCGAGSEDSNEKIIGVLRLKYAGGLSHAQIGQVCGISKGVVTKYVSLAAGHGLTWPLPTELSEAQLEGLLFHPVAKRAALAEPDYFRLHQALKRKGVTLQLLWSEYVAVHRERAYRYSQFFHRYHQWRATQKRSMRQHHRAGEKLFIDYAGPTVEVIHRATGEVRQAQIFVAVPGASSYTYAEATWSQSLPDWIDAHRRALRFFGGAPQLFVPDNLRAAVTKACRYEPGVNATYAAMAAH